MSYRYSTPLLPGAYHYGRGGLGIPGALVPSGGTDGASALYYSLALPADAAVEVRGLVTRWPTNGTLAINEDGSFTYTGTSDYFDFLLYADGAAATADIGFGAGIVRISLNVGAGGSFSGAVQLDDATPGGGLGSGVSNFAGAVQLDAALPGGGFVGSSPIFVRTPDALPLWQPPLRAIQ